MTADRIFDIATYVCDLFEKNQRPFLHYHNAAHTTDVVLHAIEIATPYKLNARDHFILLSAAWFHDVGHLFADMAVHEAASITVMRNWFAEHPVDAAVVEEIAACIAATQLPARPQTLLQKILCDADTYHLGTEDFWEMDKRVQAEMESRFHKTIADWHAKTYGFLEQHQFFTEYALEELQPGKIRNLQKLKMLL